MTAHQILTAPLLADGRPEELNVVTVSPGVPGFIAAFVVAVLTILLVRQMLKHIRKINFLERDRLAAEERAEAAAEPAGTDEGSAGGTPHAGTAETPRADEGDGR